MNVIPSVFHQSAWYLAGSGGYCGEPEPSDTIVIPAVSHQSAWHLGGQVEKGGTGGKASERGGRGESKGAGRERFLRRESWKSFCM